MRARNLALMIVLIVIGAVGWWSVGRRGEVAVARPGSAVTGAVGSGTASSVALTPSPILEPSPHLRRITEDQRRQIQGLIAEARTRRASAGSATGGPADGGMAGRRTAVEHVSAPVKSALEEAIPVLADCYVRTGKHQPQAAVMMTLVGDPSVGTLVDPSQMFDHEHKPLDPALEHCLRDTFAALELPPLDEGDKLDIQYSFRFDD
jgi:hypothetical protein